jgi:hypothetical protein
VPSVTMAGENAPFCCQVPRKNDFFIILSLSLIRCFEADVSGATQAMKSRAALSLSSFVSRALKSRMVLPFAGHGEL